MPNTNKAHPEMWLQPFRPLETSVLAPDERLVFALHFEVKFKNKQAAAHNMFIVVAKGDKAIARSIVSHSNGIGFCEGHADDVAEYPVAEARQLAEEMKNHGLTMAMMLLADDSLPLTVNTEQPMIALMPPPTETRENIAHKLLNETEPTTVTARQVIVDVLGLLPSSNSMVVPHNQNTAKAPVTPAKEPEPVVDTATNNLKRAAEEMALIKKFGKKNMEALAKKMNYQGELLNKDKNTKTHVN